MKTTAKVSVALALFVSVLFGVASSAGTAKSASDVVELNGASYIKFIKENPVALVMFYAPWCGHCKAFKPEFERAATELKAKGVPVGRIDGSSETDISDAEQIRGFPTVRVYVDGNGVTFDGPRTAAGLVAFVEKARQPAFTVVLNKDSLDVFLAQNPTSVVGYIGNPDVDGPEPQQMFVAAAKEMHFADRVRFAMVSDPALLGPDTEGPTFELRQPDLKEPVRFDLAGDNENAHLPLQHRFMSWVAAHSMPVLGTIDQDSYQGYIDANLPFVWFVVADATDKAVLEKYEFVRTIGRAYLGRLSFVVLDAKENPRQAEALLEANKDALPAVVATDRLRYTLKGDLTDENLRKFLAAYLEGKLDPTLRSQEPPSEEEFAKSTVKKVVSRTWDEVVLNSPRDVFVKGYAEWCGHCKALAPIYEKVAESLAEASDKVIVAEIDLPENELREDYGIRGFPTLLYFPAGTKTEPVVFDGERTVGAMLKFVQEHKSADWELPEAAKKEIAEYEAELAKKAAEEAAAKEKDEAAADPADDEQEDPQVVLQKLEEARKKVVEQRAAAAAEGKKDGDKEEL